MYKHIILRNRILSFLSVRSHRYAFCLCRLPFYELSAWFLTQVSLWLFWEEEKATSAACKYFWSHHDIGLAVPLMHPPRRVGMFKEQSSLDFLPQHIKKTNSSNERWKTTDESQSSQSEKEGKKTHYYLSSCLILPQISLLTHKQTHITLGTVISRPLQYSKQQKTLFS